MSELQQNGDLGVQFYDGRFSELDLAYSIRPDHLFESTRAAEWIKEVRTETGGKLDMQATADSLGIPLVLGTAVIDGEEVFSDGCITGLGEKTGLEPIAIYVGPDMHIENQLLTFGHEVGHLFLEKVVGLWTHTRGRNFDVENFCEYFGREMVVSHDELKVVNPLNQEAITELMARYGASHQTIIFQLIMAGKLPTRVVLDSEIGEAPNPFYSYKVGRSIICIECELGISHSNYEEGDSTPLLDFRGYEWDSSTSGNECTGRREIEDHIAINKHYGRWSPEDEALIENEIESHNELTAVLDSCRNGTLDLDSGDDVAI
jgi:hypothetical protein